MKKKGHGALPPHSPSFAFSASTMAVRSHFSPFFHIALLSLLPSVLPDEFDLSSSAMGFEEQLHAFAKGLHRVYEAGDQVRQFVQHSAEVTEKL